MRTGVASPGKFATTPGSVVRSEAPRDVFAVRAPRLSPLPPPATFDCCPSVGLLHPSDLRASMYK